MRKLIGPAVHRVLGRMGYEIHRSSHGHVWGKDVFADQVELLRGEPVTTIFDLGANTGQTTDVYRRLFPEATIHAFEPSAEAFAALSLNHHGCRQIVAHRLAVADRCGRLDFHRNQCDLTNSLLAPDPRSGAYVGGGLLTAKETVQVDAVRLDEFCLAHQISAIDVLKIDVQGAEGCVLRGADSLLEAGRVRLVFTEVQFAPLYRDQTSFEQVHELLSQSQYRLFGLYNLVYGNGTGLMWADALYLPQPR
jgi:FkbM family methyltransferase